MTAGFCTECGAATGGGKFCAECGHPTTTTEAAAGPRSPSLRTTLCLIAALLVIGAAVIFAAYQWVHRDDGKVAAEPPTVQGLVNSAGHAFEAIIAGDSAGSYRYLSAGCKARWGVADWGGQIQIGKAVLNGWTGVDVSTLHVTDVATRNVTTTGGEAQVHAALPDGTPAFGTGGDDWSAWVIEDGTWRAAECDPVSFGDTTTSTSTGP